jgi:hypothetical protein
LTLALVVVLYVVLYVALGLCCLLLGEGWSLSLYSSDCVGRGDTCSFFGADFAFEVDNNNMQDLQDLDVPSGYSPMNRDSQCQYV